MGEYVRLNGHAASERQITGCRQGLLLDKNVEHRRGQGAPGQNHHHLAPQRQRIGEHHVVFARFQWGRVEQAGGVLSHLGWIKPALDPLQVVVALRQGEMERSVGSAGGSACRTGERFRAAVDELHDFAHFEPLIALDDRHQVTADLQRRSRRLGR